MLCLYITAPHSAKCLPSLRKERAPRDPSQQVSFTGGLTILKDSPSALAVRELILTGVCPSVTFLTTLELQSTTPKTYTPETFKIEL